VTTVRWNTITIAIHWWSSLNLPSLEKVQHIWEVWWRFKIKGIDGSNIFALLFVDRQLPLRPFGFTMDAWQVWIGVKFVAFQTFSSKKLKKMK
jgi:hypothetical protein